MSVYNHLFFYLFIILIIKIKSEDKVNDVNEIIKYCSKQGYNITDSNNKFFNDICSVFYSNNKRDISLEYRRKYYYYTNISNSNEINKSFPEIKRNNIYSCFKHHLSFFLIIYNYPLYIITIIFILQMVSFIFLFINDYKNASKNNLEKYLNYTKKKKKISIKKENEIQMNTKSVEIQNNTNNGFNPLNEEIKNGNTSKDFANGQENNEKQIEFDSSYKQEINNNDIITFGIKNVPLKNINEHIKENNNISEKEKNENINYIANRLNRLSIKHINTNKEEKDIKFNFTSDELFYINYTPAYIHDKRNLKQIYFDILSHCQIIFTFIQYFFIYEDIDIIILYYSIKINLYIIINIILLNDNSLINKIYDKQFSFSNRIIKCLIATIIVNIISQILFIFTNSKKIFIKHINKLKNSLYNKSDLLKYSLEEITLIINNNLYGKLIILCVLNILIYIISFYCSLCFCSTYYYTQFIAIQNIIICIFISQIFPFILVFIPAYIRKRSLEKGNAKLYYFSQYINLFFIP